MIYVYDILLNFNDEFYEFYEWDKNDNIYHIKKIPIFKVATSCMEVLFINKISISSEFLNLIMNKTEVFDKKRIKYLKYSCIFTDGYKVLGVLIDNNIVSKVSDLLLDEASDVISIAKRCKKEIFTYNIVDKRNINYFLTRNEVKIKKYLLEEISNDLRNNDILKLKYLYFEYFNKNIDDIEIMYNNLRESLNKINDKHLKLYELVKLSNKNTSNLTN